MPLADSRARNCSSWFLIESSTMAFTISLFKASSGAVLCRNCCCLPFPSASSRFFCATKILATTPARTAAAIELSRSDCAFCGTFSSFCKTVKKSSRHCAAHYALARPPPRRLTMPPHKQQAGQHKRVASRFWNGGHGAAQGDGPIGQRAGVAAVIEAARVQHDAALECAQRRRRKRHAQTRDMAAGHDVDTNPILACPANWPPADLFNATPSVLLSPPLQGRKPFRWY